MGRLMPLIISAKACSAEASSPAAFLHLGLPSGFRCWFAAGQLNAKRDSESWSGSPRLLKFTSSTSCPASGSPLPLEKPKSPSRPTSAAPFFTTPPVKESGAKSGPTAATSAGSSAIGATGGCGKWSSTGRTGLPTTAAALSSPRSEEHTSELQSPCNLVCRLLLEKKKNITYTYLLLIQKIMLDS